MKTSSVLTSLLLASSVIASPAVFADPGHGKGYDKEDKEWQHQQKDMRHYEKHEDDERKVEYKHDNNDRKYNDHRYNDYKYYDSRTGQYLTKDQYYQLPPGLQKNVARGKAVPPGWAKKLDNRYYSVNQYNGRNVYILNSDAYRNATVLSHPRPGEVRIRVNNRVLDVLETTRVILNVL